MGFTKLDSGIIQSSIMAEPPEVFKVWIALLASCQSNGIAPVSPVFIAAICHMDIDVVMGAITVLSSPDKYSRTITDEGRRIKQIDGGYEIINYLKYREFTYSDSPEAIRQRKHRGVTKCDMSQDGVTSLSSGISINCINSEEGMQGGKQKPTLEPAQTKHFTPPTVAEVGAYCLERKNGINPQAFVDHYEVRGWVPKGYTRQMKDWKAAVRTWEQRSKTLPQPTLQQQGRTYARI